MTFWLLSGENAKLNPSNIQTVSLVTSLTINLLTIVNVLKLSRAILKHTKTHSSPGQSSTGTIWTTIFVRADKLTASGKPSIIGTSYHPSSLPLHQRWKALQRIYLDSDSEASRCLTIYCSYWRETKHLIEFNSVHVLYYIGKLYIMPTKW